MSAKRRPAPGGDKPGCIHPKTMLRIAVYAVLLAFFVLGVLGLTGCSVSIDSRPSGTPSTAASSAVRPLAAVPSATASATASTAAAGRDRPIERWTPGIVLTRSAADVCTPGWAGAHRKGLTEAQKRTVRSEYGLGTNVRVAEWDHRISLELGGGNGPANVWPQVNSVDKARKDRLENALHRQVCDGQLTLSTAQARIHDYWNWW